MSYRIFISTQVEGGMIISNEHGIYELPQKLLNDFGLRKFQETIR